MECDKASERPLKDNPMGRGVSRYPPALEGLTLLSVFERLPVEAV
ncbi:hypothetical protein [Thermococcus sp.]